MTDKKLRERVFLERFLQILGLSGTHIRDWESPDFLLELEGRTIGVEVTDLYIRDNSAGPLVQAVESVTDRIVAKAEKLYLATGATPAHVSVLFGASVTPGKIDRDGVAQEIFNIVLGMELGPWDRKIWRCTDEGIRWDSPTLSALDSVHALGVPEHGMGCWSCIRAGWVATLTLDHLQARVSEKSAKIQAYQRHAQENWLLVVADKTNPSQAFEFPTDFPSSKVVSAFARTFYYGHPHDEVIEVGGSHVG